MTGLIGTVSETEPISGTVDTIPTGKDGGYYIVSVTQPSENTARFSFTPSRTSMPKIDPVDIILPEGSGATFTPSVDKNWILSWTNDEDLENPGSVDLKQLCYEAVAEELKTIRDDIEDLKYEAIAISYFTNDVGTVELGSVVDAVELSIGTSRTPAALTLDGAALDIPEGATVFTVSMLGLGLSAGKTWTVAAADERGAAATKTTGITFLNGVYYGVLEEGAELTSVAILGLTRKLQSGKALTFTAAAGDTQQIAFALPSRYGTPNFNVGGFDGGFDLAGTFDFINASGYTESYDVWLSANTGLGSTTVTVT